MRDAVNLDALAEHRNQDPRRILIKVALQAIEYLDQLFGDRSSLGSQMAGQAEEGLGDPEMVVASVADLQAGIAAAAAS